MTRKEIERGEFKPRRGFPPPPPRYSSLCSRRLKGLGKGIRRKAGKESRALFSLFTRCVLQGISWPKFKPPVPRLRCLCTESSVKSQYVLNTYHLGPPKSYSPPFVFRDFICQIRNACKGNIFNGGDYFNYISLGH